MHNASPGVLLLSIWNDVELDLVVNRQRHNGMEGLGLVSSTGVSAASLQPTVLRAVLMNESRVPLDTLSGRTDQTNLSDQFG